MVILNTSMIDVEECNLRHIKPAVPVASTQTSAPKMMNKHCSQSDYYHSLPKSISLKQWNMILFSVSDMIKLNLGRSLTLSISLYYAHISHVFQHKYKVKVKIKSLQSSYNQSTIVSINRCCSFITCGSYSLHKSWWHFIS